MKKPKSPCDKNCELRSAECKLTCCKWKMYEREQAEYRRVREHEIAMASEIVDYEKARKTKELRFAHVRKR